MRVCCVLTTRGAKYLKAVAVTHTPRDGAECRAPLLQNGEQPLDGRVALSGALSGVWWVYYYNLWTAIPPSSPVCLVPFNSSLIRLSRNGEYCDLELFHVGAALLGCFVCHLLVGPAVTLRQSEKLSTKLSLVVAREKRSGTARPPKLHASQKLLAL